MREKLQQRLTAVLFLAVLFGLTAIFVLLPDRDNSLTERRKLAQFPIITVQTLSSGKAMRDYSKYVADQFPLREEFRALKERLVFSVYRQQDNNGIYFTEKGVGELDPNLNEESVAHFIQSIERIRKIYFADKEVYFALIPDKNYYLSENEHFPTLDYEQLRRLLQDGLDPKVQAVDLFPCLSAESYYATDVHWRSEMLQLVAQTLGEAMGFSESLTTDKEIRTLRQHFYGVYASRTALPLTPDELRYPVDEAIEQAVVRDLDGNKTNGVYWGEGDERDRYTFFLNGSSSLVEITNPSRGDNSRLVIFRDSFGSSLAPWLIEAYGSITLVDTRYIAPELLARMIEFDGCDVLFIYSVPIVNHSETLQ